MTSRVHAVARRLRKTASVWGLALATTTLASASMAETIAMPNTIGMDEKAATTALESVGVKGKIHVEVDSGGSCAVAHVEEGLVCGQTPGVGRQQADFLDVWLVLQGRRAREDGEQVEAAPKLRMPVLLGVSEEEAIERLVAEGFTGAIEVQPSPQECRYAEGGVCGTEPGARRQVPADSDVIVFVQPERTLDSYWARPPELEGMTVGKAIDTLFAQNFRDIAIELVDDVRCKPGIVCELREMDEFISRKSSFPLPVGTEHPGREGRESYRQPDFRGDDLLTVIKKVDALGSKGRVRTDSSRGCNESEGLGPRSVCRQTPYPGKTTQGQFTTVSLTDDAEAVVEVSSTSMPDVVGMPVDDAKSALEAAGLKRTRVKETSAPDCQPGTVCSTSPEAGKRAYAQTVQTLYIGATQAVGDIGSGGAPDDGGEAPQDDGDDASGAGPGDDVALGGADTDGGAGGSSAEDIPGYEPLF